MTSSLLERCRNLPLIDVAEGDHPVMAARLERRDPGGQVHLVRVRVHIAEHRPAQPGRVKHIQRGLGDRQAGQATVGHQQGAGDPGLGAGVGQFGDPAGPEFDCGRIGPVGSRAHDVTFFRW